MPLIVKRARSSAWIVIAFAILISIGTGCRSKQETGKEHFEKGWFYAEKGWWDQAVPEFKEAVRLDPIDAKAHHSLGVAYARKNMWDLALIEFKEAVRLEPELPQAHYGLGVAYARNGDHGGALEQHNWLKGRAPFLAGRLLTRIDGKWSNDVDAGNRP
jgi:tetratricopeptide (TPR) repeat protein